MRHRLLRFGGVLALLVALAAPTAATAHPLGNFTVNHFSRLEPAGDGVRIAYVLDMAEIPTFQEQARIDADRDGHPEAHELDAYATARAEEIGRGLRLELDGLPTTPRLVSRALSFPPGQAGLATLRLEAEFHADLPAGTDGPIALRYRDANEAGRIGWREIVARPGGSDTEIRQASVPAIDQTDELRSYPEDLLNSPLDVRDAHLTFVPGAVGATTATGPFAPLAGALERPKDAYAELVAAGELTPSVILFSLFAALVLGALHALSPGHGKTVVAAYLVGARGTARHAVFLGATVTATHTIGVYALGIVTLYLSQYILPEQLYPVLQVVSGLLVVGIGAWLFATRLRGALGARRAAALPEHVHADAHAHGHGPDHTHPHDVDHHAHDHEPGHVHAHGGRAHSHLPPGADGQPVTWRSLVALGVSGGLVPCPSALVVLLSAIALHRVAFGLLLIVAFSVG
ncbi:MAG TPA: hypothetical protein VGR12_04130, partial [Solirubrobacteraceae bacterium]|nr:hypothetical protein [Solirubrobacteraceae bacterium]